MSTLLQFYRQLLRDKEFQSGESNTRRAMPWHITQVTWQWTSWSTPLSFAKPGTRGEDDFNTDQEVFCLENTANWGTVCR